MLTKYIESVSDEKAKESALLSILLKEGASDEDLLKCTEIICNFVTISDVFKMTDAALGELGHLLNVLEKHPFKSEKIKEKLQKLVGDALREIKGHDPALAIRFIDKNCTQSVVFKDLEKIKLASTESAALYRTVGIIGNSVYQNVFLMYDEVAAMFSHATSRAIEKQGVSSFFQIYLDDLSGWMEKQIGGS